MSNYPILIVGAGPVGLSLATALMHKGLQTEIFEADPQLNNEIRASTLHPRTLELFHQWGVVDQVITNGYKVEQLMYWERSTQEKIASFEYATIAQDTPFPFRLQCPQHILTRTLKPIVEASQTVNVHMGHKLIDFTEREAYIEATFETANGRHTVKGAYLCAADGANSFVRQQLGMGFAGITYEDRFLLIGTDFDFGQIYPDLGPVNYIFDPKEWVIMLRLPDLTRVVFRLKDGEDVDEAMSEPQLRKRLWGFMGKNYPFNILTTQVYRVHQRVADSFRHGRVLLLGDAAHINNPMGGMGMNSGIHDAANLADKLEQMRQSGSDSLLDQYSRERRQVALDMIQSYTDKRYKDMSATDDSYRQHRDEQLRKQASDPAETRAYLLTASMLANRI